MNGNLPIFLDPLKNFIQLQTNWAKFLNPIIGNTVVNGIVLKDLSLSTGDNVISHLLQRNIQGYFVVDQNAAAQFYRKASSQPTLTLILNSSANVVISLYVF